MEKGRPIRKAGPIKRFDQKYTMFNRPRWDQAVTDLGDKIYSIIPPSEKDGYTLTDRALQNSLWYVEMAFVAGSLAHFIRDLGYTAIASGNDTGLNIPVAIDAGLGELGGNGLLITPDFGPRVRIAKVLTDLPLAPDEPIDFGVARFCEICKKCAENCPGQAIQYGDRTDMPLNVSTSPGVMKWPIDAEKISGSGQLAQHAVIVPIRSKIREGG